MKTIRVLGGFWRQRLDTVIDHMIPYQWEALNDRVPGAVPSHALENFRIACGEAWGEFDGTIFQDSDVAKWVEAASYALADHPDPELEAKVDEAIRLIANAQGPDGYINTWFTVVGPDKRWTDLPWGHELYCGGHLIEAAVAHYQATGSRKFLEVMMRYADGLIPVFGPGGSHEEDVCGHPEIELALHRLADATGEPRYRELAHRFVDLRGHHPERFLDKQALGFSIPVNAWFKPDYFQAHAPVREQHHADGHAVRAMYLYNAMARQAKVTGDPTLRAALDNLWDSVTARRMYVTGGLGSHAMAERFSIDYDLPPDTAYTETCASIGLVLWAQTMMELSPHRRYADVAELALFNGVLSGMALDGTRFFYVNPLQVVPRVAEARSDLEHVRTARVAWLGCSCCPPNIARTVTSVGQHVWSKQGTAIRIDQFIDSEAKFDVGGRAVVLRLKTDYPWDGLVAVTVHVPTPQELTLSLRIPGWCRSWTLTVAGRAVDPIVGPDGYVVLTRVWSSGERLDLVLALPVRFLAGHPRSVEQAGQVAVARGPLVFCAEEVDNGPDLHNLSLDPSVGGTVEACPELGGVAVVVRGGRRTVQADALYPDWAEVTREEVWVRLVPYHQWGNRAPGQEMRVWLRER